MSIRFTAAALAFTTLASCSMPRTGMVIGAVSTAAGALMISTTTQQRQIPDTGPADVGSGLVALALGFAFVAVGLCVFTGSALSLSTAPSPALAQPASENVAVPTGPAPDPNMFAPPGSATAVLAARSEQLTAQIWIESRAGHCGNAIAAARRLALLDRAKLIALVDRNPAIASCVAYKM